MKKIILLTIVTALPLTGQSILGDVYQSDATVDGFPYGPHSLTANVSDQIDLYSGNVEPFLFDAIGLKWVDGDSFDIFVEDSTLSDEFEFNLTLSDLDFKDSSGNSLSISGLDFNYGASDYDTFFQSPENPTGAFPPSDPQVSSTANSVTLSFGEGWGNQLINDRPVLRFDVQTVPEPGTSILTLVGAGFALFTRRRKS